MKYTPALDGLRAIAVLAVMLYHGGVALTGGGFLGVDIFFVLSGFLITTLLLLEFEGTGRLDLPAFWGRRARRLLPALFVVLVVVLVYAAFLSGQAADSIRADVLAALFYVSNWWFIASGNSYFEQFQDPSPLTHTWSLAIEEQWYLLLPLALVLLLPRVRSRRSWALGFGLLALVVGGTDGGALPSRRRPIAGVLRDRHQGAGPARRGLPGLCVHARCDGTSTPAGPLGGTPGPARGCVLRGVGLRQ